MVEKNKSNRIGIVGAGPGGLAAGMLLSSRGFGVEIFEKESVPGGRTSEIIIDGYRFDVGPTFFMMKFILDEIFEQSGKDTSDYLEFMRLSPMYRLVFADNELYVYDKEEKEKMAGQLDKAFPGEGSNLAKFYKKEEKRFEKLLPILQRNNQNILDVLRPGYLSALPYFSFSRSVYDVLGDYFSNENARLTFTFQSKYLGMSPWECPGIFGIVPFVEHDMGVYHIKGGLSEISRQMARACKELGADIHYDTKVKRVLSDDKKVDGIELESGQKKYFDSVILNADFGYSMSNLFAPGKLRKYSREKLEKKKLSCSIFMLYLGVKRQYRLDHNTIVFAKDYKKNVDDIFSGRLSGKDISFYVRDTSTTDPSLAPEGKSALYVLTPVPNNRYGIDWDEEKKTMRNNVLDSLKNRLGMDDIEGNIEVEKIITPKEWEEEYNVYEGAVFNLAHNLSQMMWFRPHNRFEELRNCYLVGGGTHPGSGLPTIYESARITSRLICKSFKKQY